VLAAYYVYLDGILGRLLAAAPVDTNVIVVSDHGMSPVRRGDRFITPALSGGHLSAPPAFIVAAGPDIRDGDGDPRALTRHDLATLGSVLDVTPTVLALLDLPVGRDLQGDVMSSLLSPASLERSPVHYVPRLTEPGWYDARTKPRIDSAGSTERLEQLRSLGYLEH
jgi:arylsulfatase A-like enzyme